MVIIRSPRVSDELLNSGNFVAWWQVYMYDLTSLLFKDTYNGYGWFIGCCPIGFLGMKALFKSPHRVSRGEYMNVLWLTPVIGESMNEREIEGDLQSRVSNIKCTHNTRHTYTRTKHKITTKGLYYRHQDDDRIFMRKLTMLTLNSEFSLLLIQWSMRLHDQQHNKVSRQTTWKSCEMRVNPKQQQSTTNNSPGQGTSVGMYGGGRTRGGVPCLLPPVSKA